jgi:hypothetical protein
MKILLASFMLLLSYINQAQTRRHPQVKRMTVKSARAVPISHNKPVEQLSIGDTCYVISDRLPVRGRPELTSAGAAYLLCNAKVTVQEVVSKQWLLVDSYNGDVGIQGYVSRQGVSRKKTN